MLNGSKEKDYIGQAFLTKKKMNIDVRKFLWLTLMLGNESWTLFKLEVGMAENDKNNLNEKKLTWKS